MAGNLFYRVCPADGMHSFYSGFKDNIPARFTKWCAMADCYPAIFTFHCSGGIYKTYKTRL